MHMFFMYICDRCLGGCVYVVSLLPFSNLVWLVCLCIPCVETSREASLTNMYIGYIYMYIEADISM